MLTARVHNIMISWLRDVTLQYCNDVSHSRQRFITLFFPVLLSLHLVTVVSTDITFSSVGLILGFMH